MKREWLPRLRSDFFCVCYQNDNEKMCFKCLKRQFCNHFIIILVALSERKKDSSPKTRPNLNQNWMIHNVIDVRELLAYFRIILVIYHLHLHKPYDWMTDLASTSNCLSLSLFIFNYIPSEIDWIGTLSYAFQSWNKIRGYEYRCYFVFILISRIRNTHETRGRESLSGASLWVRTFWLLWWCDCSDDVYTLTVQITWVPVLDTRQRLACNVVVSDTSLRACNDRGKHKAIRKKSKRFNFYR